MATNLDVLAELVGGRLVNSDARQTMIDGAATLADAGPGDISLLDNVEKAHGLARSRAGAVVVPRDFLPIIRRRFKSTTCMRRLQKSSRIFGRPERPLESASARWPR